MTEQDAGWQEHEAGLWPVPGDGVLARRGDLVLLAGSESPRLVETLLGLIEQVAAAGGDGRALTDAVAAALDSTALDSAAQDGAGAEPGGGVDHEAAVLAFGPAGAGLAILASDAAWAEVTTERGTQLVGAGQPGMMFRLLVRTPVGAVRGGIGPDDGASARTDRFSRLDAGTVRAGGLGYYPAGQMPFPVSGRLYQGEAGSYPSGAHPYPSGQPQYADQEPYPGQEPYPADDEPAVEGVYCENGHFNDPEAAFCAVCGVPIDEPGLDGGRASLGVLVLDDGSEVDLDTDYVIGREPTLDDSVAAGQAQPLRLVDETGIVSRVHVRVHLDDWRVLVTDLDSANGTRVRFPGQKLEQPLLPHVPMVLVPGCVLHPRARG
ncbi:MAG: FHA domain-containing protein, partial [Actinomycetota bacterium]|nr:FHA domain-containing protein [Actinomycetota bacterium]